MFDVETLIERYAVPDRARPHLRVSFVSSLDGAAWLDGRSGPLNDEWDQQVFATLRRLSDAVLVGAGTVRIEGYDGLTLDEESQRWRVEHGLPPHVRLAIVSHALDLDPTAAVFTEAPVRPLVVTHATAPAARREALAQVADVLVHGERSVDLPAAVADLAARGMPQVLCEGGPTLLGALVAADAVDELDLTISPVLVSGTAARIAHGPQRLVPMRMVHALPGGPMLFLRYVRA
ncbi:MAG TPA: pyrimidine reductase family protein [Actinotalea caeni]|uniref:pyrimidine reductase family protein n=1 Tax=Actinotalea caeni TaxID=1348467 RepID=UPI002B4B00AC|nr:pyrimidine reductase family protein [Actinotalea caeni]HLV55026.1 pyrimidine reductase family protein [Actinotalea caeni]